MKYTLKKGENSIQSQGGKARAAKMTPEQRSETARTAALARWSNSDAVPSDQRLTRESHAGTLKLGKLGDIELPCAVLDNGRRVLKTRGINAAFGSRKRGPNTPTGGGSPQPPAFLSSERMKPFISPELHDKIRDPIPYRPKVGGAIAEDGGRVAYGYDAEALPLICEAIQDAFAAGKASEQLAVAATIIHRGLARVGVIALIDEATGYQEVRDKDELRRILEKYVSGTLLHWTTETFPREFFQELFRLRGWVLAPGMQGPRFAGKLVNELVYDRLPPGVLAELRSRNPTVEGSRKHKHWQFLTSDMGHPHLRTHINQLLGLMRACTNWSQFVPMFQRSFPKPGDQLLLLGAGEPGVKEDDGDE